MKIYAMAALALLMTASAGDAAPIDAPKGPVILRVTGDIQNKNSGGEADFDQAMLESIAGRHAVMQTPWTDGMTAFDGPLLRNILEKVGAKGKKLKVKAINDYSAEVPMEDVQNYDTMLALKMNGQLMSVRDKGPLFMIYPFDTNPNLYNEKYFSRSVWQISEIEVVD